MIVNILLVITSLLIGYFIGQFREYRWWKNHHAKSIQWRDSLLDEWYDLYLETNRERCQIVGVDYETVRDNYRAERLLKQTFEDEDSNA